MPLDIKQWLHKGEKDQVFLIKDIATHGCSGAVTGIIYYYETTKFHVEHEKEIWDLLYQYAQDAGQALAQPPSSSLANGLAVSRESRVHVPRLGGA